VHDTGPVLVDHRERESSIPDAMASAGVGLALLLTMRERAEPLPADA